MRSATPRGQGRDDSHCRCIGCGGSRPPELSMRSAWKSPNTPLTSHSAWRSRISKKNRQQGTSAPTLAAAWAGPVDMLGAMRSVPILKAFALESIVVERESRFDAFEGPRNHDLVAHGHLPDASRVVVCVEAKAGEQLGPTVEQYRKSAQ